MDSRIGKLIDGSAHGQGRWEAAAWIAALVVLTVGLRVPGLEDGVCLARVLGLEGCPGCGIGRSMTQALRGDFAASWNAHPLGIAAVVLLGGRILTLLRRS